MTSIQEKLHFLKVECIVMINSYYKTACDIGSFSVFAQKIIVNRQLQGTIEKRRYRSPQVTFVLMANINFYGVEIMYVCLFMYFSPIGP